MQPLQKYGLLVTKIILTLAFIAAGLAKLAGAEMMVQVFEAIGVGQWFRYVTGIIEVGGAIILWIPGRQLFGSMLLLCTMIGAALAHFLILGPSAVPAILLGILAAITAYGHRDQSPLN